MTAVIDARELRKRFPGGRDQTIDAVRGVSLQVAPGEIVGFLGPNGAGKTTTLRMLTTLLPIDGGRAPGAGLATWPPAARTCPFRAGCTDAAARTSPGGWGRCSTSSTWPGSRTAGCG